MCILSGVLIVFKYMRWGNLLMILLGLALAGVGQVLIFT